MHVVKPTKCLMCPTPWSVPFTIPGVAYRLTRAFTPFPLISFVFRSRKRFVSEGDGGRVKNNFRTDKYFDLV